MAELVCLLGAAQKPVTGSQEAEVAPKAEGIGVTGHRQLCQWAAQMTLQEGGLLCLAQSDPRGGSLLKNQGYKSEAGFPTNSP